MAIVLINIRITMNMRNNQFQKAHNRQITESRTNSSTLLYEAKYRNVKMRV